jgi:hypothetical protein
MYSTGIKGSLTATTLILGLFAAARITRLKIMNSIGKKKEPKNKEFVRRGRGEIKTRVCRRHQHRHENVSTQY